MDIVYWFCVNYNSSALDVMTHLMDAETNHCITSAQLQKHCAELVEDRSDYEDLKRHSEMIFKLVDFGYNTEDAGKKLKEVLKGFESQ